MIPYREELEKSSENRMALAGWNPDLDSIRWYSIYANAPKSQCCDFCGRDTRFGTGLFVNRIPAGVGYGCPDCMSFECDRCHELIGVDEDRWLEWSRERVCDECITPKEEVMLEDSGW